MDGFEEDAHMLPAQQTHASLSSQTQPSNSISLKSNPSDLLGDFVCPDLDQKAVQESAEVAQGPPVTHSNGFGVQDLLPEEVNIEHQPLDIFITEQNNTVNQSIMDANQTKAHNGDMSPTAVDHYLKDSLQDSHFAQDTPSPDPNLDSASPNPILDSPSLNPFPDTESPNFDLDTSVKSVQSEASPEPQLESSSSATEIIAPIECQEVPPLVVDDVSPEPFPDAPSPVPEALSPGTVLDAPSPVPSDDNKFPKEDAAYPVLEAPSPIVDAPSPVPSDDNKFPKEDAAYPVLEALSPIVDAPSPFLSDDNIFPKEDTAYPDLEAPSPIDAPPPVLESASQRADLSSHVGDAISPVPSEEKVDGDSVASGAAFDQFTPDELQKAKEQSHGFDEMILQQVPVETRINGEEEPLGNLSDQNPYAHSQEETRDTEALSKMAVEDTGAVAVEPPPELVLEKASADIGDLVDDSLATNVANTIEPVDPVQLQEAIPPSKRETPPPPALVPEPVDVIPTGPLPSTPTVYIGPEVKEPECILDHFTPLTPAPIEPEDGVVPEHELLDFGIPHLDQAVRTESPVIPAAESQVAEQSSHDLLDTGFTEDSHSLPEQTLDSAPPHKTPEPETPEVVSVPSTETPEPVSAPSTETAKPLTQPTVPAVTKPAKSASPAKAAAPTGRKPAAAPSAARPSTRAAPASTRLGTSARASAKAPAPTKTTTSRPTPAAAPKPRVPAASAVAPRPRPAPRPTPAPASTPRAATSTRPRPTPASVPGSMAAKTRTVTSKVGSRDYLQHKPGGGDKKILDSKLEVKAKSKVGSLDYASHTPGGGEKKIEDRKLNFKENAKSKSGTLQNLSHRPSGGDKKIESKKLEWKAESKIGSFQNVTHKPTGGSVKNSDDMFTLLPGGLQFFDEEVPVSTQKLDWKAQSKIGSLDNATHKPVGGDKKIESQKLDFKAKAQSKVGSLENATHKAVGGDKKIGTQKLNWKAESKVGSLDKAAHKAGGGNVKIENRKLKIDAKSKIGSLENASHVPGGGQVKVENQKLDLSNTKSKIGSLENAGHVPAGGDVQIFDEKLQFEAESKIGSLPSPSTDVQES